MRCTSVGLSVAVAAVCGCTTVEVNYQGLPTPQALESIEAGTTTRSEVLRRLGPPEELRRPAPFDRARSSSPQRRRIVDGGDIFGRSSYTYASERYTFRDFGLLPTGPALFDISWTTSREDRWRIEFDENDLVQSVSHIDEIVDDDR